MSHTDEGDPAKILIVDDSEAVREHLSKILQNLGVEYDGVSNGKEALDVLQKDVTFDAVLLDIEMPEMNGIEFLEAHQNSGSQTHVIVCSSRRKMDVIKQAITLGALDYIMKPFNSTLIESKLKSFNLL